MRKATPTNKEMARRLLEDHIKKWQGQIDILPYPVSIYDTEFNLVMANKAFYDIWGDMKDTKDIKCHQLFHDKDTPVEDCPMTKTLRSGKAERSEIYTPSLKMFLLEMTTPIFSDGNIIGVINSFIDITSARESEEHYRTLMEVYADAINKLKTQELTFKKSKEAFFNMLEDIHESYKNLKGLFINLIKTLVRAIDAKSAWTKGHSEKVTEYALSIGREMGLDEENLESLKLSALLHDIGKIGTYDAILEKPDKLTPEEIKLIQKHPIEGASILAPIKQLKEILPVIRSHHERINGTGYPGGLKGENLPLLARILHVADVYDALTVDRPYRKALSRKSAVAEIKKASGTEFDKEVVEAFLKAMGKGLIS